MRLSAVSGSEYVDIFAPLHKGLLTQYHVWGTLTLES